jgi:hypothetical protein
MELRREINKLKMDYVEFQDVSFSLGKYLTPILGHGIL